MSDEISLKRRELLHGILLLAGATSTSGCSIGVLSEISKTEKRFLEGSRYNTLSVVADTIIPDTDVPGKWVPSLKITPGMRPFSSPGYM